MDRQSYIRPDASGSSGPGHRRGQQEAGVYRCICPLAVRAGRRDGAFCVGSRLRPRPSRYQGKREHRSWHAAESGFWRPGPYLCLEEGIWYGNSGVGAHLNRYLVWDQSGHMETYHVWEQTFEQEQLEYMLLQHGFGKPDFYSDVSGSPYSDGTDTIGIVVQKPL